MSRDNVEAIRETATEFIGRHGLIGWLIVLITAVLFVSIATSMYLAWRLDQNAGLIVSYAVKEAANERAVNEELLKIQRESLVIREKGHILLERNTRAMEDIRKSTELQAQLVLRLIDKTRETVAGTEKVTRELQTLRREAEKK